MFIMDDQFSIMAYCYLVGIFPNDQWGSRIHSEFPLIFSTPALKPWFGIFRIIMGPLRSCLILGGWDESMAVTGALKT